MISKLKNIPRKLDKLLSKFPFIHSILRKLYCLIKPGVRFRIEKTFRSYESIFLLKIGANDGVQSDPIADYLLNDSRYTGLMIEPIPQYAQMLRDNFNGTGRFIIEEAAISDSDTMLTMYYVQENAVDADGMPLPKWLRGVASLDRSHVENHLSEEQAHLIRDAQVESLTVERLLSKNDVHCVDLLHIDTEGHDYVILKQFDFNQISPKIVLFEHAHLNNSDRSAACNLMEEAGYEVELQGEDAFCLKRS